MTKLPKFETARLAAYEPDLEFLDEYAAMLENVEFIACYGVYFNHQQAKERLESDIAHFQEKNFAPFYWRDKKSGEFVGRGGLKTCEVEGKKEVELAYAIARKFWGQEIAKEIGDFSLEFARKFGEEFGLKKLVCFTLLQNSQSLRVMEKCGFVYEKDFLYRERPHKLHHLEIV
jgi:ribosomal-protein-alanine N-acetyltransferase